MGGLLALRVSILGPCFAIPGNGPSRSDLSRECLSPESMNMPDVSSAKAPSWPYVNFPLS